MGLRPYQTDALQAIRREYDAGVRKQLAAMPTGTGKTIVFANLPEAMQLPRNEQMFVFAHRDELVEQAADKIAKWNPSLLIDIEKAEKRAHPKAHIIVSSPQTLGRTGSKRIMRFDPHTVRIVIADEAHHYTSETFRRPLDYFLQNPNCLLLGVTATPNRSDGTALATIFDKIVYQMPMRKAIEDGWLTDLKGMRVTTNTNLDRVGIRAGDFAQNELERTVNTPRRNGLIVKGWIDHGWPRQTVVFCVDIQHAKDLAAVFKANNIPAEAVWGDDPDRAKKLEQHKAGKLSVLCNCAVLTEGYDDWRIACIVMARPTKSQLLYVQMAGRGTRIPEGINNVLEARQQGIKLEKEDCLLLDVVDNSLKHSLATLPSIFGLAAKMDLKGKSVLAAAKKIEAMEESHKNVDFSKLEDINNIAAYVQNVNLWEVKFDDVVMQHSQLSWHRNMRGEYMITLPDAERLVISQNLLSRWEVDGTVRGRNIKEALPGDHASVHDAFTAAELFLSTHGKDYITLLRRNGAERWHGDPATLNQLRQLKRMYFGQPLPPNLTKKQASDLISQFIARKTDVGAIRRKIETERQHPTPQPQPAPTTPITPPSVTPNDVKPEPRPKRPLPPPPSTDSVWGKFNSLFGRR